MAKKYIKIIIGDNIKPSLKERLAHFWGFTKSGRSVMGTVVRKEVSRRNTSRVSGAVLALVGLTFILYSTTRNIGGALAFDLDATPVIDVTTLPSVQSPINYTYESRGYSWYHTGADLVAPSGTPIRPIMLGTVEATNYDAFGYGNHVILLHDLGYESVYGHLSEIDVKAGDQVTMDTQLGKSGSSGFSTGPHLHLEVHLNGTPINPGDVVPGIN